MNKVIKDGLNQEINPGDIVAMANGSYVRQEFGIVTKLGNKNNARVINVFGYSVEGGSYIDATGLVVITNLIDKLPQEKYDAIMKKKSEAVLDFTRPKSSNAPKYFVEISPNLKKGWVFSFTNSDELRQKGAKVRDLTGGRFEDRTGTVARTNVGDYANRRVGFLLSTYHRKKSEWQLSLKSVTMLGLENYIDDEDGFSLDVVENLEPISRYW